jgi:alpha-N-arabinofuranosidase
LITLLRNSDRVKIACLAQLVNVIAPIMTSPNGCWAQTIYWPFMHASQHGRGMALLPLINSPLYNCTDFADVPLLDAAAVLGDDGSLAVFAINRSLQDDLVLTCDLRAFQDLQFKEHILLHHDDPKAFNTESAPGTVLPVVRLGYESEHGYFKIHIPALSWNVLKFSARKG